MRRAILFLLAVVLIIAAPHFIKQLMPFASVTGTSMAPSVKEGDLIKYEKISPSEIEVGDIIVYRIPPLVQKYRDCPLVVTHRVVEIRGTTVGLYYRTKGDNNPAQDPWSVEYGDIIGKVSQQISYLGFPLLFLKSRSGLTLIVIMFFASALCFYAGELSQIRWKAPIFKHRAELLD
jgi:signal peptidase